MRTTYTYDKANRLKTANAGGAITTYQHDAAGNRTSVATPTDLTEYTWDSANRMAMAETAAGTVTLTYNADGQRAVKQGTDGSAVGFLYDYKRLLHETDEVGGDISNTYATTTNEEFGDLLEENGESFHQYDAQADTNALLDEAGAVDARYKYIAFGAVSAYSVENGPWQSGPIDFATLPPELSTHMLAGGKKQYYFDPETELYLLGMGNNGRYYDPATARFLNEDPIRQDAGDVNLYRYVKNDPINHLDPSGHDAKEDDAKKAEDRLKEQQAAQAHANVKKAKDVDRRGGQQQQQQQDTGVTRDGAKSGQSPSGAMTKPNDDDHAADKAAVASNRQANEEWKTQKDERRRRALKDPKAGADRTDLETDFAKAGGSKAGEVADIDEALNRLDNQSKGAKSQKDKDYFAQQKRLWLARRHEVAPHTHNYYPGPAELTDDDFNERTGTKMRDRGLDEGDARAEAMSDMVNEQIRMKERIEGRVLSGDERDSLSRAINIHYTHNMPKMSDSWQQMVAKTAEGNSTFENFSGGALRGFVGVFTELEAVVAPQDAARNKEMIQNDVPVKDGTAASLGQFTGGLIPSVPMMFAAPEIAVTAMTTQGALSGFGHGRQEAAELRRSGKEVSLGEEMKSAIGTGIVRGAMSYLAGKFFTAPGGRVLDKLMLGAGGGALQAGAQTIGENAVAKATLDPNRPLTQNVKQNMLSGAASGTVLTAAHIAGQKAGFFGPTPSGEGPSQRPAAPAVPGETPSPKPSAADAVGSPDASAPPKVTGDASPAASALPAPAPTQPKPDGAGGTTTAAVDPPAQAAPTAKGPDAPVDQPSPAAQEKNAAPAPSEVAPTAKPPDASAQTPPPAANPPEATAPTTVSPETANVPKAVAEQGSDAAKADAGEKSSSTSGQEGEGSKSSPANAGEPAASPTAANPIPESVRRLQGKQDALLKNQQQEIKEAIARGGAKEKGRVSGKQGYDVEGYGRDTIKEIPGAKVDSHFHMRPSGEGRQIDNRVTGTGEHAAYVESKLTISKLKPRDIKQLKNAVKTAKPHDSVILHVAREPSQAELSKLQKALGDKAFTRLKIVSKLADLYSAVKAAIE